MRALCYVLNYGQRGHSHKEIVRMAVIRGSRFIGEIMGGNLWEGTVGLPSKQLSQTTIERQDQGQSDKLTHVLQHTLQEDPSH